MQPVAMVRRQAALGAVVVLVYAGGADAFAGAPALGAQRRGGLRAAYGAKRGAATNICMEAETQEKKKVVVTGVGCVSSVGVDSHKFFDNLVAGKSGIQKMPSWAGRCSRAVRVRCCAVLPRAAGCSRRAPPSQPRALRSCLRACVCSESRALCLSCPALAAAVCERCCAKA